MTATIFALASGAGRAGVAVMRLSGPDTDRLVAALAGGLPPPRRASLRRLRAADGEVLDRALVLRFPGPASYTGEDAAELHLHGGRGVVSGVAEALLALGARPAEPGEFTRRAFRNGRLDLAQAEAVADLAAAETAVQRRQALGQMEGALSLRCAAWAERIALCLAEEEARLDFPDEDLPEEDATHRMEIGALADEIGAALASGRAAERVRDGVTVAIVGAPNVGKSSLLNALAGREAAIVSARAGTTRDVVEVRMDLDGLPLTLLDTAGLRETEDEIEAEGVRRALARAEAADIVVSVAAPGVAHVPLDFEPPARLTVAGKADLAPAPAGEIAVSARTGAGLDALQARLAAAARGLVPPAGSALFGNARHRAAAREALDALERARYARAELRAEELRQARMALGRITGRTDVEDILDAVFSRFCVGK